MLNVEKCRECTRYANEANLYSSSFLSAVIILFYYLMKSESFESLFLNTFYLKSLKNSIGHCQNLFRDSNDSTNDRFDDKVRDIQFFIF